MIQPLAYLKEKQCPLPYLKDMTTRKSEGMSKSKFQEKKKKEMVLKKIKWYQYNKIKINFFDIK